MRYGTGLPIAGVWESGDALSNGGERIKLSFGGGDAIRDFTYSVEISEDLLTWESGGASTTEFGASVDNGDGTFTVTIRSLQSLTDKPHQYLRLRVALAGTNSFPAWMSNQGETDPLAPFGASSLTNLVAYALGADLSPTPQEATPRLIIVEDVGVEYPALRYRVRQNAPDISHHVELSTDLLLWQDGPTFTTEVTTENNGDGTFSVTVRSLQPLSAEPLQQLRLRVDLAP